MTQICNFFQNWRPESRLDASLEFGVTVEACIKRLTKLVEQRAIVHMSDQLLVHILGAAQP